MAKTELAVAELIWNMIARKTGNVGKVDFFPQKPAFPFGEGDSRNAGDILRPYCGLFKGSGAS